MSDALSRAYGTWLVDATRLARAEGDWAGARLSFGPEGLTLSGPGWLRPQSFAAVSARLVGAALHLGAEDALRAEAFYFELGPIDAPVATLDYTEVHAVGYTVQLPLVRAR